MTLKEKMEAQWLERGVSQGANVACWSEDMQSWPGEKRDTLWRPWNRVTPVHSVPPSCKPVGLSAEAMARMRKLAPRNAAEWIEERNAQMRGERLSPAWKNQFDFCIGPSFRPYRP